MLPVTLVGDQDIYAKKRHIKLEYTVFKAHRGLGREKEADWARLGAEN